MPRPPKQTNKLPEAPPPSETVVTEIPLQHRQEMLKIVIAAARTRRQQLQGKAFKDNDDKLKLLALDVRIGNLLLDLEDLK